MFEYRKLNGENWVYPWIMTFPLVTLALSGALFTIGLCLFTFSFKEVQNIISCPLPTTHTKPMHLGSCSFNIHQFLCWIAPYLNSDAGHQIQER